MIDSQSFSRFVASALELVRLRVAVLVLIGAAVGLNITALYAQPITIGIVAVVNNQAITSHDLSQRERLLEASSGSGAVRGRFRDQALETLIDETLQLQEANRLGIAPPPGSIEQSLERLANLNGMSADGFIRALKRDGVTIETIRDRLHAEWVWPRVIDRLFGNRVNVNEDDLNEEAQRLRDRMGEVAYELEEIFLPVNSPEQDITTLRSAQQLVAQLRGGAPFRIAARQLSRAPSALSGGSLGWLSRDQLASELLRAVVTLTPGMVSDPIRTADGYTILHLLNLREPGNPLSADAMVSMQQIAFPLPSQGDREQVLRGYMERIESLSERFEGCHMTATLMQLFPEARFEDVSERRFGSLPVGVRTVIGDTASGKLSRPGLFGQELMIFPICGRRLPDTASEPQPEQIQKSMVESRMDVFAVRHLNDLRQDAVIDRKDENSV